MDPALANLGWSEDQWNRICNVVAEEAQRARVCAQALPVVGLDDPSAVAIPQYRMTAVKDPYPGSLATERIEVDSDPTLHITTISVNVPLRSQELADPELRAALTMFRRAANYMARLEDALILSGRKSATSPKVPSIPPVYQITGTPGADGVFTVAGTVTPKPLPAKPTGSAVLDQIVESIGKLEEEGATGPFACLLSQELFNLTCSPNEGSLVLPRDRILPFLQGPLLRSSQVPANKGCVVALGGSPVEIVVASDINVRYLQTTPEPRYMFRMSERIALRIKEADSIAILG